MDVDSASGHHTGTHAVELVLVNLVLTSWKIQCWQVIFQSTSCTWACAPQYMGSARIRGRTSVKRIGLRFLIRLDREMETQQQFAFAKRRAIKKSPNCFVYPAIYIELLSNEATQCLARKRFYLRCLWMSALALKNLLGGSTGDQEKLLQFCFPR